MAAWQVGKHADLELAEHDRRWRPPLQLLHHELL
jgi:hypothetical protein